MERTHYHTILLLSMSTKKSILITGSLASTVPTIFKMTKTVHLWWNLTDISVLYPAGCPQNARHCWHSALLKCLPLHISLISPLSSFLLFPRLWHLPLLWLPSLNRWFLRFHSFFAIYILHTTSAQTFNKIILGCIWKWHPDNLTT